METIAVRYAGSTQPPAAFWSAANSLPAKSAVRIALVDDDVLFREAALQELERLGFAVTGVSSGPELQRHLATEDADVVLLDWWLDHDLGINVLKDLRKHECQVPVIFLTGRSNIEDEAAALDLGAVDFVDKMRGMPVLVRRIRRAVENANGVVKAPADETVCGKLTFRSKSSRMFWDGQDVGLTTTEFNIVKFLVENCGEFVTYRAIYDCVHWTGFAAGSGEDGFRTNVRSSIRRIRNKFHALSETCDEIENFASFGYRWRRP